MSGDNVVIVVYRGGVVNVYSDNANVLATVVDLDDRELGENYIHTFQYPETQFDEDEIRDLIGDKIKDFVN